jgi:uncharacterized protein YggE
MLRNRLLTTTFTLAAIASSSLLGGLLGGAAQTLAQIPGLPGSPQTLTVTGAGRSSLPADQAAVVLSYYANFYPTYSEDPNQPPPTPPVVQPADLQPVVAALTGAGIPANHITVSRDPFNATQGLRILVKVDRPSRDRLGQIIDLANTTASQGGKFAPNSVNVLLAASNCQTSIDTARQAAVSDVQSRATALAQATEVDLGGLIAVSEYSSIGFYGASGTCPSNIDDVIRASAQYGTQSYDPSLAPEISVEVGITATYEIER